jgi:hypothetical protein
MGGGAFLFHQFFWKPLTARDARIASLTDELEEQETTILRGKKEKPRLDRWRQLSLPPDFDAATRAYYQYLNNLMLQCGFPPGTFTVTPPKVDEQRSSKMLAGKKQPVYTSLVFQVNSENARMSYLAPMLEGFYRTPLLHEIKSLTIEVPSVAGPSQAKDDLQIKMTIEALIVAGADQRNYLLPNIDRRLVALDTFTALQGGVPGLALAAWAAGPTGPEGPGELAQPPRNYLAMADKNIFQGRPLQKPKGDQVDVTKFVYLTDISFNGSQSPEAFLYNQFTNKQTRLRTSPGFNKFVIRNDAEETLLDAQVIKIVKWDVIFSAGERYYRLHIGDNIQNAMRQALDREQVEALTKDREAAAASLKGN